MAIALITTRSLIRTQDQFSPSFRDPSFRLYRPSQRTRKASQKGEAGKVALEKPRVRKREKAPVAEVCKTFLEAPARSVGVYGTPMVEVTHDHNQS
jgi:hypothetical protein